MNVPVRLVARVIGNPPEANVKHYQGLPPQLTGSKNVGVETESPILILIEQKPDGVFLYRYTADGRVIGDTWHMTVDDAKEQARYEYGDAVSSWKSVPVEFQDAVAFGLKPPANP